MIRLHLLFLPLLFQPQTLYAKDIFFVFSKKIAQKNIHEKELIEFFLKKKQHWKNGQRVRPIGQSLGTPARKAFLKHVLKKSEIEMSEYWIEQKQVNGLVQPIQLENNKIVLQLVKNMPGAVGYVFLNNTDLITEKSLIIIKVKTNEQ